MRDSFVFYRSFRKAIQKIKRSEDKLALYEAIVDYALDGTEAGEDVPELIAVLMETIKPQIDANNKRFENGSKGGRPKKPLVSESKTIGSETKNHRLLNSKPNVNDNVNVNVNDDVNDNDNDNALGSSGGRGLDCDDDFNIWKKLTPEDVDSIYDVYPESGGFLIDEVYAEVKQSRRKVKDPVAYVLGYARNKHWDDKADHFEA